jgi:translation initiation factor IF-1
MVETLGNIEAEGVVQAILGNNNYRVEVEAEGKRLKVLCHLSGKMRRHKINITTGDRVKVVIPPPYDKGRITFREK